jgi:hypothetical protein
MTFKDLRKIIIEKNKELVTESKFYDQKLFLERQKDSLLRSMVSNHRKLHSKSSNADFPNDFPSFGFRYILDNVEDRTLKQEADRWYSDFIELICFLFLEYFMNQ